MTYEEWEAKVHERVKREPEWEFWGYRKALFFYDLAWQDCQKLVRDVRGRAVAEQLIRSVGSISANAEEGHGRGYGKQRNWFLTGHRTHPPTLSLTRRFAPSLIRSIADSPCPSSSS